jgi:hypothetical protein
MLKVLLMGAGMATVVGLAAQAQPGMPEPAQSTGQPPSGYTPEDKAQDARNAAQPDTGAAPVARPGMVVRDPNGDVVGTIVQVGQTGDGVSAVVVQVDGQPFTMAASTLTPAKGGFVSSMTKSQIKAAPKAPG